MQHYVSDVLQSEEELNLLLHFGHLPAVAGHADHFHTSAATHEEGAVVRMSLQGRVVLLSAGHGIEYFQQVEVKGLDLRIGQVLSAQQHQSIKAKQYIWSAQYSVNYN